MTTVDPPVTTSAVTPSSPVTTVPASPASTEAALPLAGVTIVLDPGHNGRNGEFPDEINRIVDIGNGTKACNTTGTTTDDGYPEARLNWEVARLAVTSLEALGAEVVLTRPDNDGWGPCITERAAIGNRAQADAVVSIHADGGPADGRGFHLIFPASIPGLTDDIAEESRLLADALREAYLQTGMPISTYAGVDGLSERDDLGGLNLSDVPAVFLEVGNMRNATDAGLLTDSDFQAQIAEAIVTGISAFLSPID
jgi:N-acetylmuramoyl-L-alanine amidase